MTIIGTGVSASNDPLSLLDLVVRFCQRTALPAPTTVMGNGDAQIIQIRALIEEEGMDLSRRGDWEGLMFEATFPSVAAESQGAILDLAPNNFRSIKNETIWNRTTRLAVCGPMSAREWHARKAMVATGPRYRYRLRGGNLLVNPTPPAGQTWAFEYRTKNWILDITGVGREYYVLDTDVTAIPAELILMGLRWRWKKEKALDYAEDQRTYEAVVQNMLGQDGTKAVLNMDAAYASGPSPMVVVPSGSWAIP